MKYLKTEHNTVKRGAHKASYEKEAVFSVLDACEICHVAFEYNGLAQTQPINFGRDGEKLYLHSSPKNRMTSAIIDKGAVSLNVMILDTYKLTRSAFHHSVNFRSAVITGKVRELKTAQEKLVGLKAIVNHFVADRWAHCRKPTQNELLATRVVEIEIESAVAKIASSPLEDNKEDYLLDYWAGEIQIKTVCEYPQPDPLLKEGIEIPLHVKEFYEKHKNGF